jgi:hypothetical protein
LSDRCSVATMAFVRQHELIPFRRTKDSRWAERAAPSKVFRRWSFPWVVTGHKAFPVRRGPRRAIWPRCDARVMVQTRSPRGKKSSPLVGAQIPRFMLQWKHCAINKLRNRNIAQSGEGTVCATPRVAPWQNYPVFAPLLLTNGESFLWSPLFRSGSVGDRTCCLLVTPADKPVCGRGRG